MFKDSVGRWLTKALFYEANNYTIDNAIFTTGDEDIVVKGKTLISLKKRFVEAEDPTGYTVAREYLGGYPHWKALCRTVALKSHIEEMKEELDVRLRSRGIKKVISSAETGNFTAAKYLTEKGWDKRIAGRPTKAEIERERKQMAMAFDDVEEDLSRMKGLQ